MKKYLFLTLLLVSSMTAMAGKVFPAEVKEIFEFTSIVWRLTGSREYNMCDMPEYANDIDTYFAKYKSHPLIAYCQQIRREQSIGYDAISTSAAFLVIENDKIKIHKGYTAKDMTSCESRWTIESYNKYIELLNDFYKESNFHQFFEVHKPLYKEVEQLMDTLMSNNIFPIWFETFFDKKFGDRHIYISLNNGPNNYGLVNNLPEENRGGLIGSPRIDADGSMKYTIGQASIVYHEIMHAFANPLADEYKPQMQNATEKIYQYCQPQLRQVAYNESSIIAEWLTRLFVLFYMKEHNLVKEWLPLYIKEDVSSGFIWINRSLSFLDNFKENPEKYKNINDFMPQLVAHFNEIGHNFDRVYSEWKNEAPYITEVFPIHNTSLNLTTDTTSIKIKFSKPMSSLSTAQIVTNCTPANIETSQYWRDETTYIIKLASSELKNCNSVEVILYPHNFIDMEGQHLNLYKQIKYSIEQPAESKKTK